MINAFGEAIVAVGAVVADVEPSSELAQLLVIGILGAVALWWAYFDRMEELWEGAMARATGQETGRIARDVYSILHFPMIAGVVLYAVSAEEIFLHPNDPIAGMVRVTLGLSLLLFLLPIVAATWRTVQSFQWERAIAAVTIAAIVFGSGEMGAKTVLLVTTVLLLGAMTIEYFRYRPVLAAKAAASRSASSGSHDERK
ncbi:MAG: low temperature requirement protein A [Acidimicrobiia bacterium]|nr:low temperature requirement protein A [Acidimicrobiia bacterium]